MWPRACKTASFLLPESLALRGVEARGSDERLGCVRQRLEQGGAVTVAALGGSISAGSTFRIKRGDGTCGINTHVTTGVLA